MDRFYEYINDVERNSSHYPLTIKQQIARQCEILDNQEKEDYPYYFDESKAQHAITFIEQLKHFEDKFRGMPFILEPWQVFLIGSLYGTLKKKDGLRKYKKVYTQVARKNGKTILTASLALYQMTFGSSEECYCIATKRDQARIAFKKMKGIVFQIPNYEKYVKVHQFDISIGDSTFMPMASEDRKSDGLNPSFVIVDEYHAHKNDELVQVYQDGMAARSEPVMFIITTAGYDKSASFEEYLRCKKVLSGDFTDETLLPLIFELDQEDDWEDETVWRKSNPNYNVSVSPEYLSDQYNEATQKKSKEISFKTKNLNLWSADNEDTWIPENIWEPSKQEFDYSVLAGHRCYCGIDLAGVSDLTGYTLYFPYEGNFIAKHKAYLPIETLPDKQRLENSNYQQWVSDEYVTPTEGVVTDHKRLIDDLLDDAEKYNIIEVGYDPYKSGNIISFLEDEGLTLIPIKQGMMHFSEPCKEWEKSVRDNKVIDNNPVMEWCIGNVVVKPDHHENIIPLKKDGKRHNKIDLVITSIIAHKIMMDNEDGLRDEKLKENPLNVWANTIDDNFFDEKNELLSLKAQDNCKPISNLKENPLNKWAEEYLKNNS